MLGRFSPLPDCATVIRLGADFPYTYRAAHKLTETEADATFPADQLPLVILRAQAAAMSELAIRNAHKPVQMRDGLYSQVRNKSEEHTSELQSLMRISYDGFCLKKNKKLLNYIYHPPYCTYITIVS